MGSATRTSSAVAAESKLYHIVPTADGPSKVRLLLHKGQQQAWRSERRIVAVISGTQGGKTTFGPWWLWREITRSGPGDYIAATSTYDLFALKMLPALREVFEDVLGIVRYWAGDGVLEVCQHNHDAESNVWVPQRGTFGARKASDINRMWARVILRSASSKAGLESATANAAWLDECGQDEFTLGAYEAVMRRLSLSRGRVLMTTTPYNVGWLKQRIYDRWKSGDPDIDVINFPSIVNPAFPEAEFESAQRTLDDWKFRLFYLGQFERPAGLIYSAFVDRYKDEGGHKVKPFSLPPRWPRWVGIDPGAVNQATIWLAHDTEEDVYYVYRESLEGGLSTAEHAQKVLRLAREGHERVVLHFVGNKGEVQQRLDWQAAGVMNVSEPPISDVESGIDAIISLLKQRRLFVFDTCQGLLDEFGTYRRTLNEVGEPTEKIHHKERYHRLDALRYAVVGLTHAPALQVGRITVKRR